MKYIISIILLLMPISVYSDENRDRIRKERIQTCKEYWDHSIEKCATFMTLVYAYESWFWKSRRCVEDKNCYGMKWNWYDTPAWFLVFDTHQEGDRYFAKKFYQWHYKKDVETFITHWSMTDRETYIEFFYARYDTIYNNMIELWTR